MPSATITTGTVFEDSGASLMARVVDNDGTDITQSDITTIKYSVFDVSDPGAASNTGLNVSDVVFDTLQTDARWTKDSTGYNFRHDLPASALPEGDHVYRVEYKFTPASGEVFHVVFELATKNLLGS